MARLQILELPEVFVGAASETPFILVIDQYEPPPYPGDITEPAPYDGIAEKIGARAVLVFEDAIDIPANDITAYLPEAEAQAEPCRADERAIQAEEKLKAFIEKRYVIEQERKALLADALGMDRTRDWDDIHNAVAGLRRDRTAQAEAIERARRAPTRPDVMNVQQENPTVWLHGYECGVLAVKSALRPRDEPTSKPTDA
ncbi:hypothetical protein [Streptomyces sp. KN37]|uniref:hypothetical protein n=1 Tax=Streptomyces sp. KN37 TaxID=3090667 RepID=UPI002A75A94B|nr:hypothetical protein [Streptomyces sp. KN37]WPO74016.1 hypothetical protein R9806_27050 [Streptomyces sp. KN37]